MMWVLVSWFSEARVGGIFIDDEDEDISATKGKDIIFEAIPLSTHDGEGTIDFLFIDNDPFLVDVIDGGRLSV